MAGRTYPLQFFTGAEKFSKFINATLPQYECEPLGTTGVMIRYCGDESKE